MKVRKFTEFEHPPLTVMIQEKTPDSIINIVKKAKNDGAQAFCLLINEIEEQYRKENIYREIFDVMGNCPAYIANYTWGINADKSDEYCIEQALIALECGAVLFDVPGDCFCKSENEITYDDIAIQKQKDLIEYIHSTGKEVIMSSHTKKYLKAEDVLNIAQAHRERKADISKIVTNADTADELIENYKISVLLMQEYNYPHLFLCNGKECKKHRLLSPVLGSCISLCIPDKDLTKSQPSINKMKNFISCLENLDISF